MEMKILLDYTNKRQFGWERKMCENEVKWEDKKKLLFAFYVLFLDSFIPFFCSSWMCIWRLHSHIVESMRIKRKGDILWYSIETEMEMAWNNNVCNWSLVIYWLWIDWMWKYWDFLLNSIFFSLIVTINDEGWVTISWQIWFCNL